jgi:uncharacterized NAD(P)/FAD-binding protein YdhS
VTELIGSVLADETRPVAQWCEPPKDIALREQLARMTRDFERLGIRELRYLDLELQSMFQEAVAARDSGAVDAIKRAGKPIVAQLRALEQQALFERVCPIAWLHRATEEQAVAAVNAPKLQRLLGDPLVVSRSLLLCGPSKSGKSTALAIMLRRTLAAGYMRERAKQRVEGPHVEWVYARGLAQARMKHPLGQGDCPAIVSATHAGILVLDDLGLERDHAEIVDVVHDRYEAGRITWTTTGLNREQLFERYGEAFYRRLVEGRSQPGIVVSCFAAKESTDAPT